MNDFSSRGEHRVPPPNSDIAVDFPLACDGEWLFAEHYSLARHVPGAVTHAEY